MQTVARLVLLVMSAARAAPLPQGRHVTIQDGHAFSPAGEPSRDRTIVVTIGIVSIGLMCFLLGLRFSKLKRSIFMKRNVMSIMVLIIFFQILSFITLTTVLVSGQGLMTYELCKTATWVCLIGYTFTKFMIFLFLVERVHVVRAPFMNRRQDKIYLACMAMIFIAYVPLAISSYVDPLISMDPESGRCRAGIRRSSTLPTIAVNSVVDMILTGVFLYLLRPVVTFRLPTTVVVLGTRRDSQDVRHVDTNETSTQKNIRILLWKSIVGSLLIELPMIANMIQMAITNGEELGMICLTICLVEAIWDALVIYWLAFGSSAQAERDLQRSATLSSKATLVQTLGVARSRRGSMEGGKNNIGSAVVDIEIPEGGDAISLKQMPSRGSEGDAISLALPRKCAEGL